MTRAYDKFFLTGTMENLGASFDCAVNQCHVEPDLFHHLFVASKVASQIERGNPKYICGMSGLELTQTIFDKTGYPAKVVQLPVFERSKEYWTGWILACYQWNTNQSFETIQKFLPVNQIVNMYDPFHEAPEEKFIEAADKIILSQQQNKPTNLQLLRKAAGLTQKELAELSGINLRTLQQYEIRSKDINKASGDSINALAGALNCNFYDVMEL